MGVADGMVTGIEGEVGGPAVMHRLSGKEGENPQGVHPVLTMLAVHDVVGQLCRGGDMEPVRRTFHSQATFVEVHHRRGEQELLNGVQTRYNLRLDTRIGLLYPGFGRFVPIEVIQQLTHASPGEELIGVQVARLSLDALTILHRLGDIWRKLALH